MDNSKHKQSSPQPPQPPVASDKATPRPTPLADQMPTPLAAADPAVTTSTTAAACDTADSIYPRKGSATSEPIIIVTRYAVSGPAEKEVTGNTMG